MFVSAEAAQICVTGGADSINAEGYESLGSLLDGYIENGGQIWLCPACAKAKGITEEDLISEAKLAGAPKSMAFLASGGQLLA